MEAPPKPGDPRGTPPVTSATSEGDAVIDSHRILQGRGSVTIEHKGARYRLQETRAGKLILTK